MRVFAGFDKLPKFIRPVVTVGSYDGVHRGHMVLLGRVLELARANGGESVVVTFSPHPREVLDPEGMKLLTTPGEKTELLEKAGIDNLIIIPFDREFSEISYRDFVKDYLVGRVGMADFVAGYNHHFGAGKQGGPDSVAAMAREFGFGFHPVERQSVGDSKVSSTVIRREIGAGDMAAAAKLLGYDYFVTGSLHGGGELVPETPSKLLPPLGEYPVNVYSGDKVADGRLAVTERGAMLLSGCDPAFAASGRIKAVFV